MRKQGQSQAQQQAPKAALPHSSVSKKIVAKPIITVTEFTPGNTPDKVKDIEHSQTEKKFHTQFLSFDL